MKSQLFTDRRQFLKSSLAVGIGVGLPLRGLWAQEKKESLFEISLAEWSLHRMILHEKKLDHLDFAKTAKEEFGISAVEYVNQMFMDKAKDQDYLKEMKTRADDLGVANVLIMCDGLGQIGDPEEAKRQETVENHKPWLEAAKFLGCHSIRVNAGSSGSREEQEELAADGLARLAEVAKPLALNVIVENHGGLSSDGRWLAAVMKRVNMDNCGTLPDFGNFVVDRDKGVEYDRYKGVEELMPYAKAVSAKSHDFDEEGRETNSDYFRLMKTVVDAGYKGYVGIEYEGGRLSEFEGIHATKKLLEDVREKLSA